MPPFDIIIIKNVDNDEEFIVQLVDSVNQEAWELTPHVTFADAEEDATAIREFIASIRR